MATQVAQFRERDFERLVKRLWAVAGGDLSTAEAERLAAGDLSVADDLPARAQVAIRALLSEETVENLRRRRNEGETGGVLERVVGDTTDFVPVAYLELARIAATAVARVVSRNRRPLGTGTMVSPLLFLTNNHVTRDPDTAAKQLLQFRYELEVDGQPKVPVEFGLAPDVFFWTSADGDLDATLVAVDSPLTPSASLTDFAWMPLSSAGDKHADGDFVTIIQHPKGDFKQIALRENRVVGRGKGGTTLHYGADTLGGSSGSPVFNDQFQMVALHHAGGPRNETYLDDDTPLPEDSNEGIRVSALVERLQTHLTAMQSPFRERLAEALNPPEQGPTLEIARADVEASVRGPETQPAADNQIFTTLQVPIHIRATAPAGPVEAPAVTIKSPARGGGVIERNAPDVNYGLRRGYSPAFLGVRVPLPILTADVRGEVASLRDEGGAELRYHHFSIIQNAARRLPFLTAVNIDGAKVKAISRSTGEVEGAEKWFLDPRIDEDYQLGQSFYEKQQPRLLYHGHMVRPLDAAWGSPETALRASVDTFHFSNCCPQISSFNQRAALWAGIENYALHNARAEKQRITVFTGPVFREDDPQYRHAKIPQAFWKIVVRIKGSDLRCTGFLAEQPELLADALHAMSQEEAFDDLGHVKQFQVRLMSLEPLTGFDFGELSAHDTHTLESDRIEVTTFEDVSW